MATKFIGLLTAGGDSPGLNAAIRGIGKAALGSYGMRVVGFRDGFRGLMENRMVQLERSSLSGILTIGGTILGTSRDKPHRMPVGSKLMDMTEVMAENYTRPLGTSSRETQNSAPRSPLARERPPGRDQHGGLGSGLPALVFRVNRRQGIPMPCHWYIEASVKKIVAGA